MSGFGITVRVDHTAIARFTQSSTGPTVQYLVKLANRVLNGSSARVNVDTGYLRSTGTVEEHSDGVRVAYRASYARWVHDGNGYYSGNPYLTDSLREELSRI